MPIDIEAALDAEGLPADPDLVELLRGRGITTLDAAAALGRDHWVGVFADARGFTRDLVDYIADLGLDWESAAKADSLKVDPWECELGVPLQALLQDEGVTVFAAVFEKPPAYWREQLAARAMLFGELEDLMEANELEW